VDELVISLAFPGLPVEQPKKGYTFEEVDAAGTERLVAAAREAGLAKVIYISGAGAGHDAERHWFRAKARAEDAVRASGMSWTIIRPTWIFGPDDVSLNRFLGFARVLPFVPLTNLGRQELAPVYVRDVAVLAADSLEQDAAAEQTFEIGGPETLSMRDILHRAMSLTGMRKPLFPAPAAVDFVNQPATVDLEPLLAVMPRTLTPLEVGLATYLGPEQTSVQIADARAMEAGTAS
jgi:NADH dehydrogenase